MTAIYECYRGYGFSQWRYFATLTEARRFIRAEKAEDPEATWSITPRPYLTNRAGVARLVQRIIDDTCLNEDGPAEDAS